ncbi:MAG: hypothetical protein HXY50_17105 [Ignavibacteriaceae bacterium]|nr:hypothetical protein [Ignavibacteriaceae bacterium]
MNDGAAHSRIRLRHLLPLFGSILPTIIGSIIMWPPEAMKKHLIGSFILMLVSVVGTYLFGIYLALEDRRH